MLSFDIKYYQQKFRDDTEHESIIINLNKILIDPRELTAN